MSKYSDLKTLEETLEEALSEEEKVPCEERGACNE